MTIKRVVKARLWRLWTGLREMATLRRREKKLSTYLLRLLVLTMLAALPLKKLYSLGIVDAVLALIKVGIAAALVAGVLGAAFAAQEVARRRATRNARVSA